LHLIIEEKAFRSYSSNDPIRFGDLGCLVPPGTCKIFGF